MQNANKTTQCRDCYKPGSPVNPVTKSSSGCGRSPLITLLFALLLTCAGRASGANIVWISDVNDPFVGFSPGVSPNTDYADQGFITLLQNAGHDVKRYNGPNSQNTLLTQADIDALNTNDLLIIARVVNSGAWQAPQGAQWNTNILKPIIAMSPYIVRTLATGNRMGWFTGGTLPDDIPTVVTAVDPTNPAIDYILGGVPMLGSNSVNVFDELLDRNTSFITDPPMAGGRVLVSATFPTEGNTNVLATGALIAEFPAGTVVRGGDILPAYRMYFSGGSRESGSAPNTVALYAGRENLSPTGENIFLRGIEVALRSGSAPPTDPNAPIQITSSPASATVLQGRPVSFSVSVSGAAPRLLQWQRDIGDGVTFTNIPDASTTFSHSQISIPAVALEDENARFRVEASNAFGTVHSAVATLNVTPDTAPPVALAAGSLDGQTISVCFDELLDNRTEFNTAEEPLNYQVDDGAGPPVTAAKVRADGKSVLLTLGGPLLNPSFKLSIFFVEDRLANPMDIGDLFGTNHAFSAAIVGALNPPGSGFACASNTFEISGGGLDLQSTSDQFQFFYRTYSGDFDARVRVSAFTGTLRLESVAKAILTARATADANSAAVNVFVTPPYPAPDWIASNARTGPGVATNILSNPARPAGYPNAWMRIKREENFFTTFRSTDGVNWVPMGSMTVNLPADALIGMGVNSHRNGFLATATFNDFSIVTPDPELVGIVQQPPATITIPEGGNLAISVTATGSLPRFRWQKEIAGEFQDIGGATNPTFAKAGAVPTDSGNYRVVITNRFNAVTSEVAVVTVNPDMVAPTVVSAVSRADLTSVVITFSEPMEASSAVNTANYVFTPALTVNSASLNAAGTVVTLQTEARPFKSSHNLRIGGLRDRAHTPNPLNPDPTTVTIDSHTMRVMNFGTTWRHNSTENLDGINWYDPSYVESAGWADGNGFFGLETSAAVVALMTEEGGSIQTPWTINSAVFTYYLRKTLDLSSLNGGGVTYQLRHLTDDGVRLYVNGSEALRYNMPEGDILNATPATAAIEAVRQTNSVILVSGSNLIAAEVHQNHGTGTSSDVLWGAEILAIYTPSNDIRLSVSVGSSPCGVTISWNPADGTLQESSDLVNWSSSASQSNPQTVPCTGSRFFRVLR